LYLWSHFQRYSCTCIEDIYTKLVKSSVFPYILISSHLYLLGHNDSRAENSHGKHKHVYVLMYEFSGALVSRHRRYAYASDHKTLYFPCFLCVFSTSPPTVPSTKPPKLRKNGLQPPIEDDVILHEMHSFFKKNTHTYLFYIITNFHTIWYTPWYFFYHPCSKCGHLNDSRYGIKIYVNGWYLKSYIHIWKLQCQSFHMICLELISANWAMN